MKLTSLLIILVVALPTKFAYAQAFGIEMGQKIEDLRVLKKKESSFYEVVPPKPHPEFESYTAIVSPKAGVCAVIGIGKTHQNDRYGSSVRSRFEEIEKILQTLYGSPERYSILKQGALWSGPQDWVMAVQQNERSHASYWLKAGMPANVGSVGMSVSALSSSGSWITLRYEFRNFRVCKAELDAASTSGL